MEKIFSEELKQTAAKALNSQSMEEGAHHLTKALSLFSQETAQLESSYQEKIKHKEDDYNKKISELKNASQYFHTILESISDGILFLDMEGKVLLLNQKAKDLIKADDSYLFTNYWHHFPDDFFGYSMKDALFYGLTHKLSYICLSQEEKRKELEIRTTLILEPPTNYQGILILIRDITEWQKLQSLANRSSRLEELGKMASCVAHEIKNPLGGIRGYAMLLARELEENKPLKEMADHIIEGTKSLDHLVTKVLQYAKPINIHPKSVELASFLRKLLKLVRIDPSFPKKISIEMHTSQEPLYAPIDERSFYRAVFNLIVNAYQSIGSEGKIIVSLMKQNTDCILSISDNGQGIEEENLEEIFSPFFTTKERGNGLGLSETSKIIQAHFGKLEVRSKPKLGTTFTITLPLKRL